MPVASEVETRVPWTSFAPTFVSGSGRASRSVAELSPRTVSLRRLALFLSPVAIMRDFLPDSPWSDVRRVPVAPPESPVTASDPAELPEQFADAVVRCMADAATVAVSVSGGMDSAAVLAAVTARARGTGQRVVVVTSDSVDDQGRSPAQLVRDQIRAAGLRTEPLVIGDDVSGWPRPSWNAAGPGFYSTPREHLALARTAGDAGAEVLLHGDGADQLLRAPGGLLPELAGRGEVRTALRYLRDSHAMSRSPLVDLATLASARIRRRWQANLLLATAVVPRYLRCAGTKLLTAHHAEHVDRWFRQFLGAQVDHHLSQRWTAARALLFESLFPHDTLVPATTLRESSPFCDKEFAEYCWRLPTTARYERSASAPYRRGKSLALRLVPPAVRPFLPVSTMYSIEHAARYWRRERVEPVLLIEHGVLRADWPSHLRSLYDLQMVDECERWLGEALRRGAQIGDD